VPPSIASSSEEASLCLELAVGATFFTAPPYPREFQKNDVPVTLFSLLVIAVFDKLAVSPLGRRYPR